MSEVALHDAAMTPPCIRRRSRFTDGRWAASARIGVVASTRLRCPLSQYTDSYYLQGASPADAEALARRVGRFAAVFPPGPRWTQLLFARSLGEAELAVADHNLAGILVHYSCHEDHCVALRVFEGPREIGAIEWGWDGPNVVFDPETQELREVARRGFDAEVLIARGLMTADDAARIRARIAAEGSSPGQDLHLIAHALGLPNYRWVSGELLANAWSRQPDVNGELIGELRGATLVGTPPRAAFPSG
jgi:hypothetical protein